MSKELKLLRDKVKRRISSNISIDCQPFYGNGVADFRRKELFFSPKNCNYFIVVFYNRKFHTVNVSKHLNYITKKYNDIDLKDLTGVL